MCTFQRPNIPNAKNETLVQERVYEIATNDSVGLGKTAFAQAVEAGSEPYADIDFEGFRRTFEVIREAIDVALRELAPEDAVGST